MVFVKGHKNGIPPSPPLSPTEPTTGLSPIIKSLGFYKAKGLWHVATITSQGDKVLSIDLTEGDVRSIALEDFKIKAANSFLSVDE